jgi:hypothetical protein
MSMNDANYRDALNDTLRKMVAIREEIERLEITAAKLRQFFFATLNMLPEDEHATYMSIFREANEALKIREASLKDAVYEVLSKGYPKYLTTTEVRDRLQSNGFDFSGYTSNALASVSTTLRRLKPEEVETLDREGVVGFRLRNIPTLRAVELGPKKMGKLSDLK